MPADERTPWPPLAAAAAAARAEDEDEAAEAVVTKDALLVTFTCRVGGTGETQSRLSVLSVDALI